MNLKDQLVSKWVLREFRMRQLPSLEEVGFRMRQLPSLEEVGS